MSTFRKLLRYLLIYKLYILGVAFLSLLYCFSGLLQPWLLRDVVSSAIQAKKASLLLWIAVFFVTATFLRAVSSYGKNYLMAYVSQRVILELRSNFFQHLQRLSLRFYKNSRTGELISKFIVDTNVITNFLSVALIDLLTEPVQILGAIIIIFFISWKLTLISFLIAPVAVFLAFYSSKKTRQVFSQVQQKVGHLTNLLHETITGVQIVKAFAMEKHEVKKFTQANWNFFSTYIHGIKLLTALPPLFELLGGVSIGVIILIGGLEVIRGTLAFPNLLAFIFYLVFLAVPIQKVATFTQRIQHSLAAAERVFEVLEAKPEIKEIPKAKSLPGFRGKVEFKKVWFSYDTVPVLRDINLVVNPGEVVAIVGPSGVGKTTLVNLLLRFYDVTQGKILLDGEDIKTLNLSWLRNQIGIVTQEIILFEGTIKENILYGKPSASLAELEEAAARAQAMEFISKLPQGFNTPVGERGVKLSGGEKQRIAIARAIIRKPRLLILDEATSALDSHSEQLIQQALKVILPQQTTFVIAHRLSTIKMAHRIVVIENGQVCEEGSHRELLVKEGVYQKLYRMQFEPV
jgi:subfamily B ATP-binding cassette protein MsbA